MIKLIQCVKCRTGIPAVEFRRFWQQYGRRLRDLAVEIQAVRCTMSTALVIDANLEIMLNRGTAAAFDGVAEIWHRDGPAALAALQQPAAQARVHDLWSLQEEFMDLQRSSFFLAFEDEVFEIPAAGA